MTENTQWTVETLKESVDQRFGDNQKAVDTALLGQEKAVGAAFLASEKAIIKAEILTDKRFDTVNEAIIKVTTQSLELMPRAEYVANHKALDDKIEVINSALNKTSGDKNLFVTTSELDTKLTLVVNRMEASLGTLASTMKPILDYVANQKGQTTGSQMTKNGLIQAISLTSIISGMVIGIVVFIATTFVK